MVLERIFAALGLLVCVALLLRMVLPERQRWAVDHHARRVRLQAMTLTAAATSHSFHVRKYPICMFH